jgi:hypothetical protein
MIAPVYEHVSRDRDPLRSKTQGPLNLANEDGFAAADGCLGDNADMLPIKAMVWQVEESRRDLASWDRLRLLRHDWGGRAHR